MNRAKQSITPGMIIILVTAVVLIVGACNECWAQEVAPSPVPGSSLEVEWQWAKDHPRWLMRESKRVGNVFADRKLEEKGKIPGPPTVTEWDVIIRTKSFTKFTNTGGNQVRLNQGWNYHTGTIFGVGPPEHVEWGAE